MILFLLFICAIVVGGYGIHKARDADSTFMFGMWVWLGALGGILSMFCLLA